MALEIAVVISRLVNRAQYYNRVNEKCPILDSNHIFGQQPKSSLLNRWRLGFIYLLFFQYLLFSLYWFNMSWEYISKELYSSPIVKGICMCCVFKDVWNIFWYILYLSKLSWYCNGRLEEWRHIQGSRRERCASNYLFWIAIRFYLDR